MIRARNVPILAAILGGCLLAGCSRREPPAPRRTAPWPAAPLPVDRPTARQSFTIGAGGEVQFELPARGARINGAFRVARGSLDVDLMDLAATRGNVEVDLASVRVLDQDGAENREASARAQSWLDVGPSRPEAARDRHRWARFALREVHDPSATAAHEGRAVLREAVPPRAGGPGAPPGTAGTTGAGPRETRAVELDGVGTLLVHGYEVELGVRLRMTFEYPVPATPGAIPTRLLLETVRPFPVSLAAHDIVPRDGAGLSIGDGDRIPDNRVGKEAKVSAHLVATPRARDR